MPWLELGALVAAAVALRVATLPLPGHYGDVTVMARWAEEMVEVGPTRFYDASGSIYPALLYPLWLLGALFDGDALRLAIKAGSIPFDVAVAVVLFAWARLRTGEGWALTVSGLYLFNPATILAGPVWGQVDSAGTLAALGAVVASARGRDGWAGALAVLAGLMKPQFGLVALPVVVVAAMRAREQRSWGPVGLSILGGLAAYAVIATPLFLHPPRYVGMLAFTAGFQPYTSLHAFNPWGLIVGFEVPDAPYVGLGTLLLVVGAAGAMLGLRRGRDLATVLAVATVLALAFYFLPTRVHERYLFPILALLAPFAVLDARRAAAYVTISLAFAASLLYALHVTTPFDLPGPVGAAIETDTAVWLIGAVLIGSAVAWVWLLLVRPPGAGQVSSPVTGIASGRPSRRSRARWARP